MKTRFALLSIALLACGGGETERPPKAPAPVVTVPPPSAPADPLGPRPDLGDPAVFTPPVPVSYTRPGGLTVWLLERHALPIVSMQLVVPAGAAYDPEGKGGLAVTTANMLDEGAGKRGALDVARDLDRLGATLATGAYADYGFAHLTVLKKNLAAAGAIFGDVIAKPQWSPVEWKRVRDLWLNGLKARQSEPQAVASVVVSTHAYPAKHPYAHPADGVLASAARVGLDDVKKFYAARWRPDRATVVVVGDVTRQEVDALLDASLAAWKAPAAAAETLVASGSAEKAGRRFVVVDRPDAPQSVISIARPGVASEDENGGAISRVNAALGGSFTSRLNQDLREEHGWTYGAGSRFSFTRWPGLFIASAAVHTEHTGDALKAMLADIESLAKEGLKDDEVEKTKKLARADLVEAYETVEGAASRLGRMAGTGLKPNHDAVSAERALKADKAKLAELARQHFDPASALIVIVGPRAKLDPQLKAIGITNVETSGPEGK
jgi:zinc protease